MKNNRKKNEELQRFAKYLTHFHIDTYLFTEEKLKIDLERSLQAKLSLWSTTKIRTEGDIEYYISEPNESKAINHARYLLRRIFNLISIETRSPIKDLKIEKTKILNLEDFPKITSSIGLTTNAIVVAPFSQNILNRISMWLETTEEIQDPFKKELIQEFLKQYGKSKRLKDSGDKIFEQWKALEQIIYHYEFLYPKSLNIFINEVVETKTKIINLIEKNREIIDELINANLVNKRSGNNVSDNLRDEWEKSNKNYKNVLRHIIFCIYEVRNSWVHNSKELPVIKFSIKMLDEILHTFWQLILKQFEKNEISS